MKTHIFNPWNDLALANSTATFTPPLSSLKLADAGQCLPIWYGDKGDFFIGAANRKWLDEIFSTFDISVIPALGHIPELEIVPWGWSAFTYRHLINLGCKESQLPDLTKIEGFRTLSGRCHSSILLNDFINKFPTLCANRNGEKTPFIAFDTQTAMEHIRDIGVAIIKLPWSGAGRGQQISNRTTLSELETRITGMIKHQGAVEITPFYNKILDFAMLWEQPGKFAGYSLFDCDSHGGWKGNILMSDFEIERKILETYQNNINFEEIKEYLGRLIELQSEKFDYHGPVGVDFIVARQNDGNFIVPVEINWRRTMGHVSHRLANKFMAKDSCGNFFIVPSNKYLPPYHNIKNCNIQDKMITDGILDLTPPGGDFRFILNVTSFK